MPFCPQCGASHSDGQKFCTSCGAQFQAPVVPSQPAQPAQPAQPQVFAPSQAPAAAPVSRAAKKLHCPQCKSDHIMITTESSVNAALTTTRGNLSATSVSNTHRNYWVCSDCGTKFRNIQSLEEEIHKYRNTPLIFTIIAIVSAIVTLFLIVQATGSFLGFLMIPFILGAGIFALVAFIFIFVYKSRLSKMRNELAYLKENCFD